MMSHILYWLACCLITSPPSNNTVVSQASARGPSAALLEHKGCQIMSSHPHDCSLGRAWRTSIMDTTMRILTPHVPHITVHLSYCWCSCPTTLPLAPLRKMHVGFKPIDWTGWRWDIAGHLPERSTDTFPALFPGFNFRAHHPCSVIPPHLP